MNFAAMLENGPRILGSKPPAKPRKHPGRTKKRRNAWGEAFDKIGGQGNTNELSQSKGTSSRTAWKQLNQLVEEGLVERGGTTSSSGNGKDLMIWRWKGSNAS